MNWGKFFSGWRREGKPSGKLLRLEKRRGPRVDATMPVFIYARVRGEPFAEHAETMNIGPQGGLVALSTELQSLQILLVTNLQTNEDLACRVARLVKADGKTLVGVEFLQPCPRFWLVDFSSRAWR